MKKRDYPNIKLAISIYDFYTDLFKEHVLNYDELSKSEKELYLICAKVTLKFRGMIERPDFLLIE